MTSSSLNSTILEPLFAPWAEPNAHRVRAEKTGDPAVIVQGRRASPIDLVSNLRSAVRDWREAFYIGASDTTIQLLNHWFGRAHRQTNASGEDFEFRYYFCQREAIETLIYLKEVRRLESLFTGAWRVGAWGLEVFWGCCVQRNRAVNPSAPEQRWE
jgi:type III restriction enzyme